MRVSNGLTFCSLLLLALLTTGFSHAKPLEEPKKTDTELSDSNGLAAKNKTAVSAGEELKTATNLALAGNYKYDVEILESGDNEDEDRDSSEELEERFKGHGIFNTDTDTFIAENIEMTPVDVESSAISESHMLLSIVLVVVALVSVCLYAGLVIWRSHLEQRYGMRERLVNRDVDEEGVDDPDYHVTYPHTLSPYAPTTTTATTRS
ncbi:hypothetical protein AWZ03_006770 [Drosophila navojoa]|uniref:Uncharacterized protein n=1 Tax=Drosophila navojoa TaxID=7232 RepID=A0A484BDF6_DRONA|nr:uncharacterized protein LOC108656804 [Drosophila navojoa]TDG46886.1 hypothetical protein AWZ03_006770 [Drosophila navojoa]